VGSQEGLPIHGTATSRIDPILGEHAFDRISADLLPEVHQRAANARGSPKRILDRHPNDQALDFTVDSGPTRPPLRAPIVFPGDQLANPAEQRFRRDDGGDPSEAATTKALRVSRQSTPLGIREPQAFPVELLAENAVLLLEYSTTSCWWRPSHPASSATRNCSGNGVIGKR
jgi:hypothetical protein